MNKRGKRKFYSDWRGVLSIKFCARVIIGEECRKKVIELCHSTLISVDDNFTTFSRRRSWITVLLVLVSSPQSINVRSHLCGCRIFYGLSRTRQNSGIGTKIITIMRLEPDCTKTFLFKHLAWTIDRHVARDFSQAPSLKTWCWLKLRLTAQSRLTLPRYQSRASRSSQPKLAALLPKAKTDAQIAKHFDITNGPLETRKRH